MVASRGRKRAPELTFSDRLSFALSFGILSPSRLLKSAILIKPSTLLKMHQALIKRKYRLLYGAKTKRKPGPSGPPTEIISAVVAMKQRNPRFGCRRIAMQISNTFGVDVDKDLVYRILSKHYRPKPGGNGPSWLTFIGHTIDSLWSLDFFRVESFSLRSHWIMVVMDQFSRKIIGFAVHAGDLSGTDICVMFNGIISKKPLPNYLSSDNDPLFQFHRWRANLRILGIEEIKSVPYQPISHPFVERLIKSIRQELTDQTFFYNSNDLQQKLDIYKHYFNEHRVHMGLHGNIPNHLSNNTTSRVVNLNNYRCKRIFRSRQSS